MSAVLEARGLTVSTQTGGGRVDILRDVGFTLQPGRIMGLVGESGAGKSMLGRVIAQTLPPAFAVSGGALAFQGTDLLGLGRKARQSLLGDRIAFIPQEPLTALNPVLTIGRQFGEHLARLGVARFARREVAIAALTNVRLRTPDALLDRYPFQLSGGMCQRVLIAMAFASDPALIVADEPTTALDVSTQSHVVQIIRGMQKRAGTALLFITHDLRLASHICDDICVLYAGDIVERGPAHDVIRAPRHPYTHALRLANPPVEGTRRRLVTLPEQMPGLGQFAAIKGCRFAPRCPVRADSCAEAVPPLREIVPDHAVRCTSPAAMLGKMSRPDEEAPSPRDSVAGATALLQLGNLSKVYPGETTWRGRRKPDVVAVRRADLHVQAGEFVGVVGESGSGKSSLARLVMGLEAPTTGTITLDGHDVTARNTAIRLLRLERLQMIFQDPQSALNPRRTVARLITQAMEAPMHRAAAAARHDRACGLLEETGLGTDLLDRYPAQLSGGQKQRVNIARALCITPRLLVADEIVSGLDVSVQAQILNLLLDLRAKRDISLLFISHDLAVVRYLCSRVIVMHQGEIVEAGPVADVFDRPQHSYTRSLLAAVPPDDPTVPWPVAAGA